MLSHAMILAAGKGTRLKPITDYKPKALVEINGIPMLEWIIKRLIRQGISSFTINIHHFPGLILDFLQAKNNFGVDLSVSDESDALLDSGGGIHKASALFPPGQDILIHNVDVISNINLQNLYNSHVERKALATLAVRDRITQRYFLFDNKNQLAGWTDENSRRSIMVKNDIEIYKKLAFSGIYILSSEFIRNLKNEGSYSILDEFLRQAEKKPIFAFPHDEDYWKDVGKPDQLAEAGDFLRNNITRF